MSANLQLPVASPLYSQQNEEQTRGMLRLVLAQVTQPAARALYGLATPDTVLPGCLYFTVNETTRALSFFYQDSVGVLHGPIVIGTY